ELERIILKAMEKEVDTRYQTAGEMGEDFERLLYAGGAPSQPGLAAASPTGTQPGASGSQTDSAPRAQTAGAAPSTTGPGQEAQPAGTSPSSTAAGAPSSSSTAVQSPTPTS